MDPFGEIVRLSDSKQKEDKYNELFNSILAGGNADRAKEYLTHLLSEAVPLVISRRLLTVFAQRISELPPAHHRDTAEFGLEKIQSRASSFVEQCSTIRENLAQLLEQEEEWSEAARVLSGIDYEVSPWQSNDKAKLEKFIKIAMLYLEDQDHGNAEVFIRRASLLINSCPDPALQLQYKISYARVLDAKRRFLEVAMRYYELSVAEKREVGGMKISERQIEMALMAAVKCTILAPPCPQRSRMLATLYKDESIARLPVFPFLEKVFMERILKKCGTGASWNLLQSVFVLREEVERFAATLEPHQLARLSDGSTVLDKAVLQHNILSASKLYYNIAIDQLASLLGVDPDKAETITAEMITEGRVRGYIDQVQGFVYFSEEDDDPLHRWDRQIQVVCQRVNQIVDNMDKKGIKIETSAMIGSGQNAGTSS